MWCGLLKELMEGIKQGLAHREHRRKAISCQLGQAVSFHASNPHLNNQATEHRKEPADISYL